VKNPSPFSLIREKGLGLNADFAYHRNSARIDGKISQARLSQDSQKDTIAGCIIHSENKPCFLSL